VTGEFFVKRASFGFFIFSKKKKRESFLLASQNSIDLEDGGGRW
jgi:hypothetical protein